MTWKYDIAEDGSSMDIIDHNGNVVKTIQNDGSGFTIPSDILKVMKTEVDKELPEAANAGNSGNPSGLSPRGGKILRDLSTKNIEEKQ